MPDPYQSPKPSRQPWPSEQPRPKTFANPYAAPTYPGISAGQVPLWAPLYGASLTQAVSRIFKKYATFTGRASRSEYWWWALVSGLAGMALGVLMVVSASFGAKLGPHGTAIPGPGYSVVLILQVVLSLAVLIPNLAVTVRRLHDTGRSGWSCLLILVPMVGPILLIVFMAQGSNPAGQRFDVPQPAAWHP